jgi:hypothetical protein
MEQLPKIVQGRLQETAKPGVHPDPDLLAAFVEKSLNDRERSQVLQHLASCADCREVVTLAMPQTAPTALPTAATSRWLSWPVLRWGALAACVVVVSAAVTLRYGRHSAGESSVAERIPAAAPASPRAETNAPQRPGEKLAAKIPPPAPFQSDRDFGFAGKLAKQSEESVDAGVGVGAARTRVSATHGLDQNEKDRELSNNRVADSVTLKSADKPAPPVGMIVTGGVAPLPAAKAAPRAPAAEARNDTASAPGAVTEAVTVGAETNTVLETMQTPARKAKDESTRNESRKEVQASRIGAAGAAGLADRKTDSLSAQLAQTASGGYAKRSLAGRNAPHWTLSADGILQRSFDSGKTWQTIPVASNLVFRALAANDSDIWVGGASGALYHSSDAGQHWVRVYPAADGTPLTADIVTVEFSDAKDGKLTTSDHATWTTSDAGVTWEKN